MNTRERFSRSLAGSVDWLPGQQLPWLGALRRQALADFAETGYPTLRDEDWKYTSVAQIEKGNFPARRPASADFSLDDIAPYCLAGTQRLVFVDGHHAADLSSSDTLPSGITVTSLATMLERTPERLRPWLARPSVTRNLDRSAAFTILNNAYLADGAFVHLQAGAALETPLHLLFVAATPELATHTRNLVIADADSRACIIEHHVSLGVASYSTNVVTDIVIGRHAAIEHHKVQEENAKAFHVAAVRAELGQGSRFASSSFAFGGKLARTDITIRLDAEGAKCTLDGLYLADGRQHVDHHTRIDHLQPRCTSHQLYKGVLAGAARGVFNGKVIVHADAQSSDAAQVNRNLLLSEHAEMDTKPQLEIWADDVKCSHGATVAQLDAEQVFYLRSRGLDDRFARALLTYGFAAEMVELVGHVPLRMHLERVVRTRLAQVTEVLT